MPDLYVAKSNKVKPKLTPKLLRSNNPVAAFALKPSNVFFENQKEQEEILLLLRSHWVTNLGWITLGILFIFLPLFLLNFPVIAFLPLRYKLISLIGWYLLLIAFIFERFLSWFFNVGIITTHRVVDIDFYGLLYKEISDAELEKIQDVTEEQVGAIRTIFDFGDILIQTAGERKMIEFSDVPHPRKVIKLLQEIR